MTERTERLFFNAMKTRKQHLLEGPAALADWYHPPTRFTIFYFSLLLGIVLGFVGALKVMAKLDSQVPNIENIDTFGEQMDAAEYHNITTHIED